MISIQQLKPHESAAYRLLRLESLMLYPDEFNTVYADAACNEDDAVVQLSVAPHALTRGLGERLINAVLQYGFEGLRLQKVELGVVAHNFQAIRLYERIGFREFGRMEGYFSVDGNSATQLFMVYHSQAYAPANVGARSLIDRHDHAHANAGAE